MKTICAEDIDAVLPQTQCGLCGYDGCKPYAKALSENSATINLCPPGGVKGLLTLAELLNQSAEPYLAEMQNKAKPTLRAIIREAECIGCTKCIKACPVDAILGAGKLMHTVITDECTGCELCIAPCPVDCIEMVISDDKTDRREQYRNRYQEKHNRLSFESKHETTNFKAQATKINKQDYIKAALERVQQKRTKSI
jgi:electron transport complex protein RnfB